MASRLTPSISNKASTDPLVRGLALTNELANQAFPESSHKRWTFSLSNAAGTVGAGNTPLELFIDGTANFRLRAADSSTMMIELVLCYYGNQAGNTGVHTFRGAVQNRAGVVVLISDSTNTKMPIGAASVLAVSLNGAGEVQFLATGLIGDTAGRWQGRATITEITDLG